MCGGVPRPRYCRRGYALAKSKIVQRAKVSAHAGALLAMSAVTASMVVPRSLSELPLSLPRDGMTRGEPPSVIADVPPPLQSRLRAHLASRAPGLPERDRLRLAAAILEEAARAGLDPLFLLAVIEVESRCDTEALSESGARGLMQVLPSTLRGEAARSRLLADDPSDPVLNVKAGVRYYLRLLRLFGSPDLALMAYNAGPNRISSYLRSGSIPDRFRAYPRRVHAELGRLRRTMTDKPAPLVAASEGALPVE